MISINAFKKACVEAIFPAKCLVCNAFFHPQEPADEDIDNADHAVLSDVVCSKCLNKIIPVRSPMCPTCGEVFQSAEGEDHTCEKCIQDPKQFRFARAYGMYDATLMSLIQCFKYKGKIQLAQPLGNLLCSVLVKYWKQDPIDLIIPVPLANKRFRERGFNQAYLLVQSWNRVLPVSSDFQVPRVATHLLLRHHPSATQTGLGRRERRLNIKNAFSISDESTIKNQKILLVDDVYTTGATAEECTKTLLRAGANRVDILTMARA